MTKKHDRVLTIIAAIRNSFPDAAIIYTHGACYSFYQILKAVFPEAEGYMADDSDHIVIKIGEKYYDIFGEYVNLWGQLRRKITKLTPKQHRYWSTCVCGQRVEYMLRKYNKY